tara:strand:+ start:184 stop:366 length:183 start_codon:yes stop_codon:yes gene_type:complete
MIDMSWWKCSCRKCDRMKKKFLQQQEIQERLLKIIERLNDTQLEMTLLLEEKEEKQKKKD